MDRNPQIELAEQYVSETGVSIFLTGKAGTGKTTFLHHIVEHCHKRSVVLAPTGVAAVNAGGVTIHSFFQLPFCPYLPDVPELVTEYQMPEHKRQLRKSKIDIIRTLELLIIDEISMVRADLLDAVDDTLRRYRRSSRPFGGVQLLMIGDVQQLAPVVTDDEKPYMDRVYPSPFFFHSKALQRLPYLTIQLTTIYRQQDPTFVRLLNNIRDSHFDPDTLAALNKRVKNRLEDGKIRRVDEVDGASKLQNSKTSSTPNFLKDHEPILLTTHNYQADRVNQQRLANLTTEPFTLEAVIKGNFPESSAPTDPILVLKPGAQVMFVKNDSSGAHRYFNGKIGTVEKYDEEEDDKAVLVRDEDGDIIRVTPEEWENIKYDIDPDDNQIKQHIDGTFSQYPLKTAWAITIHKAQGLTFDHVQVDAAAAFAYGQVYVALSRCRSLEGLTLLSPITPDNVFVSRDIDLFNSTLTPPEQAATQLDNYRIQYYYDLLFELFSFNAIQHECERLERLFQEHLRSTYPQQASRLTMLMGQEVASLIDVAERFRRQLGAIGQLPAAESKPLMAERIHKATAYFIDQLDRISNVILPMLGVEVDNKDTAMHLADTANRYREASEMKRSLLTLVEKEGFTITTYLKGKSDFVLQKPKQTKPSKVEEAYANVKNPKFIKTLTKWRTAHAKEDHLPAYTILTQKSLLAIADTLPRNRKELLKVPGLGNAKVAKYGAEILQLVEDYIYDQEHPKEPSFQQAARLWAEGKTIEEIAGEMLRAVSTVEGYLVTAVENGILDPELVLPPERQDDVVRYMMEHPEISTLKEIHEHFGTEYSYFELRIARILSRTDN